MKNILQLQKEIDIGTYARRDLILTKGEGALVYDIDGKVYIDCIAGMGVANVGHCHPKIVKAVQEQVENFITCPNLFVNEPAAKALELLISVAPDGIKRGFFCNSGTESMEAALKFARYSTGKTEFISAENGFHGRTYGALSATHKAKYREGMQPFVPGFNFVPYNNFEALKNTVTAQTAGIILEVVQGEGGINIGKEAYFRKVRALCDEQNIILIIDEVQTGFCRTGRMFACNHFDFEPDILCVAKAIAGGLPMGAVLCSDKIKMSPGKHGSTFGGNPLVSAAAIAAINIMLDEDLAQLAEKKGDFFIELLNLSKSDKVVDIRHLGLMIGIELNVPVKAILAAMQEKGVLAFGAGEYVIRLLPPLIIDEHDLEKVVEVLEDVLVN